MPPTPGLPPPPPHPSTSKRPPPTPITAGAFSFSLPSSTPKRPRQDGPSRTPVPPSNLRGFNARSEGLRNTSTPRKPVHSLNALPSPFGFPPVTPAPKAHKKLTAIIDARSPFIAFDIDNQVDDASRIPLGQLPSSRIEDIPRERVKREEEGIGVSPRKSKGLKWTGKGPPPPSLQLASLLSSTNSSLLLFYSSLQRTLHPPPRTQKPGGASNGTSSNPITPRTHIWGSAAIVLRPLELASNRTHHGILLRCLVISERGHELGPNTDENDPFASSSKTAHQPQSAGKMILVNLQSAPHECPRLGVDSKVMVGKMQEDTEKTWEIGIWAPFHNIDLHDRPEPSIGSLRSGPPQQPDLSVTQAPDTEDGQEQVELETTATKPNLTFGKTPSSTRVIFASRFLIAETT